MRNKPGEANPGFVDSCSLYAEGAENLERAAGACTRQVFCGLTSVSGAEEELKLAEGLAFH
jgi:hypothetical protein